MLHHLSVFANFHLSTHLGHLYLIPGRISYIFLFDCLFSHLSSAVTVVVCIRFELGYVIRYTLLHASHTRQWRCGEREHIKTG